MKRFFPVLLILVFLLSFAACAKNTQYAGPSVSDVVTAYSTAVEAYAWFDMTTMPLDDSDTHKEGASVYNRVDKEGITSLSSLKAYLNTLFTPELTESLLNMSPDRYRDFNGVLYAVGAEGGGDIYLKSKRVEGSQIDDTHWKVTITYYADYMNDLDPATPQVTIGYSQAVLNYDKTNVGWRFSSFCPTDGLDLKADTVYEFTYNIDAFDHTDFDSYSDLQLSCYLLHADGAYSEAPSELLARRFLKNPSDILNALAVVEQSPWENKDMLVSSVGYSAAVWFSSEEKTEFEKILNSGTAAQSDTEHTVLSSIAAAYKKTCRIKRPINNLSYPELAGESAGSKATLDNMRAV